MGGHAQDRYTLLLARARGDYVSQLTLNELLTAKHGRHVVSATLALLLPSLIGEPGALPQWAQTGAMSALSGQASGGDARLLQGLTTDVTFQRSAQAHALWQRHSCSLLADQLVTVTGLSGTPVVAPQPRSMTSAIATVGGYAAAQTPTVLTQNLRPLATTV